MIDMDFLNLEQVYVIVAELIKGQQGLELSERARVFLGYAEVGLTLLSLLFLTGIIYALIRVSHVHHEMDEHDEEEIEKLKGHEENPRWENIMREVSSPNENDWKHAIIDADSMLDELLTALGYAGAGVGEKLKGVPQSSMRTLDLAWEAHKVRNRVAHDGSSFVLTEREAKRAIDFYRQVFEEFSYL